MITDVLYVAWDRYEFTRFSFEQLLANTNWDLVRDLHVYDDGSTDGTREFLLDTISQLEDMRVVFHETELGSPVAVMNDYIAGADSDRFAKIDNDIVVPPGWLEALSQTMDAYPHVEILGMEAGRMGVPYRDGINWDGVHTVEEARWIGGIGLIRTATLGGRPRMNPNGRFGWTEWQREYSSNRIAWIKPDLAITELSRVPLEPWLSVSETYRAVEVKDLRRPDVLERDWPRYHEKWCEWYWSWWPAHEVPDPDKQERIRRWSRQS